MLSRCSISIVSTLLVAVFLTAPAAGAELGERLSLTMERVVVFKDGYALVIKRGKAKTNDDGEIFTENVPDAAVLGSFWATPSEGRLVSMNAGMVEVVDRRKTTVPCVQHMEILHANRGKECVLDLSGGHTLRGIIKSTLVTEVAQAASPGILESLQLTSSRAPGRHRAQPTAMMRGINGQLFVLETQKGDVLITVSQIQRLTIADMNLTSEKVVTTRRATKRLTFRFEKKNVDRELTIMYFIPGIRWIPSYRLRVSKEGTKDARANIELQAEILNELEDLKDVPVDLVVGVPNIRFRDVVSPFSLEATMRNALHQAAPQLMGQQAALSNSQFSSRAREVYRPRGAAATTSGAGSLNLPPELSTSASNDLFVYSLPKLSLAKGHRAAVRIFDAKAKMKDVYSWKVHLKRQDTQLAPRGSGIASPLELSLNKVWHELELTNETDMPWTTGPVLLLDGFQPLAQELMTYTPPGGTVRVPVTVAVDVRGEFTEAETARTPNALKWSYQYAKIEKKARLEMTNFKKTPVFLEITCEFGGKATQATHDGQISRHPFQAGDWERYRGHPAVNNHSKVIWCLDLKPGQEVTTEVDFHFFTRH
jgi:hypothetical protein